MVQQMLVLAVALALPAMAHAQPSYLNFEAGHVRPAVLSPDGSKLFVVNTPDDRLEIFSLASGAPVHQASVPVGLSPIAVAAESNTRVWVVNHLSDSVSVVDVASSAPRVVHTLLVGDEPQDIVFAGIPTRRAFVTTAHRGQNHPTPRGDYDVPSIGRANVWVFDPQHLGATLGGTPNAIVQLFGDKPRALAVSANGERVYAAVFHSGNRTMALSEGHVCNGGPTASSCATGPGGLPAPVTNAAGDDAPEVGLIVRYDPSLGFWKDELGRNWNNGVRFDLPDLDVFEIDATQSPPAATQTTFAGVGTVLFGMVQNPSTGALYVSNTDANNDVRFEGPGDFVRQQELRPGQPATVRGHLHQARITVISAGGTVTPVHLNPHIEYDAQMTPPDVRDRSLATPLEMVVTSDGGTLYVAAYGSAAVGVLDTETLEAGNVSADPSRMIHLGDPGPVGPSGLVLDEARGQLYVVTRFDNSLVRVSLDSRAVVERIRLHTPEPVQTIVGRPLLYDAQFTSSNGEASCSSCHVFGDLDDLAWDLGNPDAAVENNPNPFGPTGSLGLARTFHPLKGPMTTQSLRGMAHQGPLHWRGDRSGTIANPNVDPMDSVAAFMQFNGAFEGLLGRDEGPLPAGAMLRFAEFALDIQYPPNPMRQLDNSLRDDEQRGFDLFNGPITDTFVNCNGCHTLERAQGFFGSNGTTTFENEPQHFKVAHLRNAYQKVGMFGMAPAEFFIGGNNGHQGDQIRGFGFLHDGSDDTIFRFLRATVFQGINDGDRRDLEALVMVFDSTLAPVVGQQVTLDAASGEDVDARIDLFVARAQSMRTWLGEVQTAECDLVAHGVVDNTQRGYWLSADGLFISDDPGEAGMTDAQLRALGRAGALTYTCAPPGSGLRMALDRDEDGLLNQADDQPALRPFVAIPSPGKQPPVETPEEDNESAKEAPGGGCSCAGAASPTDAVWVMAMLAVLRPGRRRKRAETRLP